MSLRPLLMLMCCCLPFILQAQIVNTERMRVNADEDGWAGAFNLGLSLVNNKGEAIFSTNTSAGLEFLKKRHRILLLGNYSLLRKVEEELVDEGFGHLRYNYRMKKWLIAETFGQIQFNSIRQIQLRMLSGAGPRFRIVQNDSLYCFIGSLYMFEYEEESTPGIIHRDHRISSYLSLGYAFLDQKFSIDNITYYQPKANQIFDYRISSQTSFTANITDHFSLKTSFNFLRDSRPPEGIPETRYSLISAFGYKF